MRKSPLYPSPLRNIVKFHPFVHHESLPPSPPTPLQSGNPPNVASSLRFRVETKVLLSRNDTERVRVAHTTPPALNTDDWGALVQNAELDGVTDTPLEAAVDILLPRGGLEVGLGLGEVEGPDSAVQVSILQRKSG